MRRSRRSFPLLSLPELPLRTIIRCLDEGDKLSLATVCRTLAMAVSAAAEYMELTVTYNTGWKGLCKVLATNTITCKTMRILAHATSNEEPTASNPVYVLLRPRAVSGCTFKGIKRVEINALLPCLLPPNVARVLPDLEQLSVYGTFQQDADLQPLPYSSSLRHLTYVEVSDMPQLPSRYHTAEDLRRQLPNIDTLEMRLYEGHADSAEGSLNCVGALLSAWGNQLTELDFHATAESINLKHCTRLKLLTFRAPVTVSLSSLPTSLTTLNLYDEKIQESDIKTLLHLPLLRFLSFLGFSDGLQQDWSHHPCTWHQLDIDQMHMAGLSKLPLHSLRGEGCLKVRLLILPDPYDPDGLADVEHAAQCVSNAGLIIEGLQDWLGGWNDGKPPDFKDVDCAEVLRAASRVVQPCSRHDTHSVDLTHYPQTLTAQIRWLSPALQEYQIISYDAVFETPPWFWQELQSCCNLHTVHIEYCIEQNGWMASFHNHIMMAARHLLAVTGRTLTLVFTYQQDARLSDTQAVNYLKEDLQNDLPSCVELLDLTLDTWHLVVKLGASVLQ